MSTVDIRAGGPADAPVVLAMLDGAVRWLVALGRTGQWGSEPASTNPRRVEMVQAAASEPGRLHISYVDDAPAGALVVGQAPANIPGVDEPELYVNLLVTDRRYAGRGVGAGLVAHARDLAAQQGVSLLRVDCYAGDDSALVRQYEHLGFTRTAVFTVGGWPGQVLAIRL